MATFEGHGKPVSPGREILGVFKLQGTSAKWRRMNLLWCSPAEGLNSQVVFHNYFSSSAIVLEGPRDNTTHALPHICALGPKHGCTELYPGGSILGSSTLLSGPPFAQITCRIC